jgi:hypothetical protein
LAAAIAVLLAVVLPRRQADDAPVAAAAVPVQQELARLDPVTPARQPVGQLAREATARYATLVQDTSDSVAGALALWQPTETPSDASAERLSQPTHKQPAGAPAAQPVDAPAGQTAT